MHAILPMKNYIFLFLLTCFTSVTFSQIHEVGFFVGGTNYIGDIGKENYLIPNDVGFGLVYKYNLNPRIALRGTYTYMNISGDDTLSNNSFRSDRGLSFSNSIHELAAGIEFNFFDYNIQHHETSFTPYILAEAAFISYQKISNYIDADNISYESTSSFTLPVGVGIKGKLSGNLAYAIEAAVRFTFVDDLDYTTPEVPNLDFEGNGYDHYIFTGFSLVYSFGRPPCYAPRD